MASDVNSLSDWHHKTSAKLDIPPSTLESNIRSMNINKYRFKAFWYSFR